MIRTALLATAIAAGPFATIASAAVDPAKVTGEIVFYTHFTNFVDDGRWDGWVADFRAKYPDADVEVIGVSNYRKDMPTRIASGDYGDVLNVLDNLPPSDYPKFYAPLTELDMRDTHRFVERYEVDGEIYGYVYGANVEALVYNKDAFAKAGIDDLPTTRTELFAACDALKAADIVPIQINMGAGWPMQQWDKAALMEADDGDYYESMLTEPAPYSKDQPYGRSIALVEELHESGCTEPDYTANNWEQSKSLLAAGEAGMWFLANWSVPQAIEAGEALGLDDVSASLGMFPLPIDDSGELRVLVNPDWAIGVSRNSKHPETAKAWIEFLLTETDVANAAGFLPGDTRIEPTLPQLQELLATEPGMIDAGTPSSEFKQAMADARLDFMTGTYIRDAVLAEDFDAALDELNARWARATGQ